MQARAMVTPRMHPMHVNGKIVHQVGLPYHWGYKGIVKGDVVNDLIAISEEPNVRIMEAKALVCNCLGRTARAQTDIRKNATSRKEWRTFDEHYGLPHRLHAVHRLQSLRSSLQGMEWNFAGRLRMDRAFL